MVENSSFLKIKKYLWKLFRFCAESLGLKPLTKISPWAAVTSLQGNILQTGMMRISRSENWTTFLHNTLTFTARSKNSPVNWRNNSHSIWASNQKWYSTSRLDQNCPLLFYIMDLMIGCDNDRKQNNKYTNKIQKTTSQIWHWRCTNYCNKYIVQFHRQKNAPNNRRYVTSNSTWMDIIW